MLFNSPQNHIHKLVCRCHTKVFVGAFISHCESPLSLFSCKVVNTSFLMLFPHPYIASNTLHHMKYPYSKTCTMPTLLVVLC